MAPSPFGGREAPAWAGLLLANLFWAGNALVARAVAGQMPPFALAFWRWSLALALLLPFVIRPLWQRRDALRRAGWRLPLVAAFGISGYNTFLYSAAHSTVAINITLLNTCVPLATALGAGLLFRQWPTRRGWLGMGLAMLGLLWLIGRGDRRVLAQLSFNPGDLLMLVAVLDWALYTLLLRRWSPCFELPPLALLGALMSYGLLMLLPLYLYEWAGGTTFAPSAGNLGAIAYTATCASLLAYLAWNHGVRVLGAARASLSNYLMPVFAALLAWSLLGEGLRAHHWVGGGLIFAGVLLATWPRRTTLTSQAG
ncbi:DMT family transporter [Pseudomonas mangiferae]|uniref:DMT family transporter n=1 Tax=Pseudomonas mangiferae TaxID=2593654 RepID=UPI001E35E783|nr:DMT family transporter [Pseudomonas mangiferae]